MIAHARPGYMCGLKAVELCGTVPLHVQERGVLWE